MVTLNIDFPKDFFKSETRSGFLVTEERKKVWAVQLDLLYELDRICKKNGINYLIDSGTLLGAVRHKGFIPWDDDIDLIMLREDYERLIKISEHEIKKPYFFQYYRNDNFYFRGHSQFRNSDTCGALRHELLNETFNQGIFIDIFPVDSVSEDMIKLKEQFDGLTDCYQILECIKSKVPKSNGIMSAVKYCFLKWRFLKIHDKYENYAVMNDGMSEYIDKVAFRGKIHKKFYHIRKNIFDDTIHLQFEFLTLPAPKDYDGLLRVYFGDNYMIPSRAPSCHAEICFNVEKSYADVKNEINHGSVGDYFIL